MTMKADRKQERTDKFNRKKKFKRKGEKPPKRKQVKYYFRGEE